jgi:hypothetical protein
MSNSEPTACQWILVFRSVFAFVKIPIMGMNYGFFDAEGFRRRLLGLTDAELITTGKSVAPAASRWQDPMTITENARKYELCNEEWRRRHPKTG